jgi:hypothetical protein
VLSLSLSLSLSLCAQAITSAVEDNVVLDDQRMSYDSQQRFLHGVTPMDFHVWKVTNLAAVLGGKGERLNFDTIGPIKLIRHKEKYNLSYNEDRSIVEYKEYTSYAVRHRKQTR